MSSLADFYEEDEPVDDIRAAFDRGQKGVTQRPIRGYACQHVTITTGGCRLTEPPTGWCGCEMTPLLAF